MQQQEEWYYGGGYGQQQRLSPSVPDYGHLNSSAPSSSSPSLVLLPNAPPYSAYATPSYAQSYDYRLGSSQQQQQGYGGVEEGGAQAMSLGYGAPSSLDNYYGGQQDATSSIYAKPYDGGGGSGEVFVYDGGRGGAGGGGASEPYGARGTGASSWSSRNTDDAKDSAGAGGGVQKYWVKLLPETTSSNSPKEVICQAWMV